MATTASAPLGWETLTDLNNIGRQVLGRPHLGHESAVADALEPRLSPLHERRHALRETPRRRSDPSIRRFDSSRVRRPAPCARRPASSSPPSRSATTRSPARARSRACGPAAPPPGLDGVDEAHAERLLGQDDSPARTAGPARRLDQSRQRPRRSPCSAISLAGRTPSSVSLMSHVPAPWPAAGAGEITAITGFGCPGTSGDRVSRGMSSSVELHTSMSHPSAARAGRDTRGPGDPRPPARAGGVANLHLRDPASGTPRVAHVVCHDIRRWCDAHARTS